MGWQEVRHHTYADDEMDPWETALLLLDNGARLQRPETSAELIAIEQVRALRAIGYGLIALYDALEESKPKKKWWQR